MASVVSQQHRRRLQLWAHSLLATLALTLGSGAAWGYVGESFLQVPGIAGDWPGQTYHGWIKLEAQYWTKPVRPTGFVPGPKRQRFSGPAAPHEGPGALALAFDKHSPALKPLMERCQSGARTAEIKYAESAELARPPGEAGSRAAAIPAYFEYSLKDVGLSCPTVADAPEQALVLSFKDIKWLNYDGHGEEAQPVAARLIPGKSSGQTQSFIITWFAGATDVSDDQCPVMNTGPTEAEYYALMSAEDAAQTRAQLASKGGVFQTLDGPLYRGPDKLNACRLPGIVPDPGHISPQSKIARGFNLDGDDGAGVPRSGMRRHKNYVSEDGRSGIDNQYFTTIGCVPGFKRNGVLTTSHIEFVRTGAMSLIVEISGIDGTRKDGNVDVTLLYSKDPMVRNSTGSQILPKYTFRVSDDPALAQYFIRVRGHMVNGVVTTDPVKEITIEDGGSIRLALYDARMRLEFQPDGTLKGILGGYEDWREIFNAWGPSYHFEQGMNFRCPAFYNAFKQAADGLRDPVSGEYHGISSAYDLVGVPAFIPPAQQQALLTQARTGGHKEN